MGEDDPTVAELENVGGTARTENGRIDTDVSVTVRESDLDEPWRSARHLHEVLEKEHLEMHDELDPVNCFTCKLLEDSRAK